MWLVERKVPAGVQENIDRIVRSDDVQHVAIMPDVHLGKLINNGSVVATSHLVYPQAVGGDIGCGLSVISFQGTAECLRAERHANAVIKQLYRCAPALKHSTAQVLPEKLRTTRLSDVALAKQTQRDGAYQFGTLGCGNHFIELQKDDAERLWLMIHSGSRAMGQIITGFHLERTAASARGLGYLDLCSEAGQAYFADMEWAVQCATFNRLAMMARVVETMEALFKIAADEESYLNSPHNFARREPHSGEELLVHRKSAISARHDELGLIAGSMGTPSFISRGLGCQDSLFSSSHGAGRLLSRTEARTRITGPDMQRQLGRVHYDPRCLAALRDEAPAAYRDIREVMKAQRELTRQHTRLTPVLNFKYADNRSDPK